MKKMTVNEVIEQIKPYQILVQSSNYLQAIMQDRSFKEFQYDYKAQKWYEFTATGHALNPVEKFVKYL